MRAAFLTAPLLLLLLSSADSAAAQSGAHLHIITYFCETDPGRFIGGGFGEMPEDCEYAGGITIRATDQSGTVVAECTTEPGACSLELPLSTTVTITEDVSTVPDGYTPTRNPIIVDTPPGEVAGDWIKEFINVATDDTVTLPSTGAGSAEGTGGNRGLPYLAMTLLLSVAACVLWRRSVRSSTPGNKFQG
jgi:hypothetical protein